ncbi:MAG: ureidoglycolate lyase [Devosia sp.]
MTQTLIARPLDAEALHPHVTLLRAEDGKARVVPEVMDHDESAGAHAFTLLCPKPVDGPVRIAALERHMHSTQTFLPIVAGRWLVVIAPDAPDGTPDMARAMAFVAGPEDAITIARTVWHAGLTVLDRPAQFGMIMWKAERGDDGEVFTLPVPVAIEV